jgi:hypothetical protein
MIAGSRFEGLQAGWRSGAARLSASVSQTLATAASFGERSGGR